MTLVCVVNIEDWNMHGSKHAMTLPPEKKALLRDSSQLA